jgi:hypothetical protein
MVAFLASLCHRLQLQFGGADIARAYFELLQSVIGVLLMFVCSLARSLVRWRSLISAGTSTVKYGMTFAAQRAT